MLPCCEPTLTEHTECVPQTEASEITAQIKQEKLQLKTAARTRPTAAAAPQPPARRRACGDGCLAAREDEVGVPRAGAVNSLWLPSGSHDGEQYPAQGHRLCPQRDRRVLPALPHGAPRPQPLWLRSVKGKTCFSSSQLHIRKHTAEDL